MERQVVLFAALLFLSAPAVYADERIAAEDFASPDLLTLGPDNVTHAALRSAPPAPHPFGHVLDLPPNAEIASRPLKLGPHEQGRLEDIVWMTLCSCDDNYLGRREGFTVVAFEGGGPEVRLVRTSTQPKATVEWFDGTGWNATGVSLDLDASYRLRVVIDLDTGKMDLYLTDGPVAGERVLVLGAGFRAFSSPTVRRRFRLGRPTHMGVGLAAWQLWRLGRGDLIGLSSSDATTTPEGVSMVVRYAAPVTLEGDAVRRPGATGTMIYTLKPARGLRDDMELADISRWSPTARVQRQTSFRRSGSWSLGLSEGPRPIDTEVDLPYGDVDIRLHFLIPKELPANRQLYLVRFKSPQTGAEPVGPSIYLDYGASPDGRSLIICQLRPEKYYSETVDIKPGTWYGLHVVTQRARAAYTVSLIDADGAEKPLNGGKPLSFFLGTAMGEHVLWRFFSIVSMRPSVTDWPKVEVTVRRRRLKVVCPDDVKDKLKGLTLKGLEREKAAQLDFTKPDEVFRTLRGQGKVIDANWPNLRISGDDAERLKPYSVLLIEGMAYLPWSGVELYYNTDGSMWFWTWPAKFAPVGAVPSGEFRKWPRAEEKPSPLREGTMSVGMMYRPGGKPDDLRAEVRWVHPQAAPDEHRPIPSGFFRGEEVTLDHPGPPYPLQGAALLDGKLYLAVETVGLATYDDDLLRTAFNGRQFEQAMGARHYKVTGFTWDPWSDCFWVHSPTRYVATMERDLRTVRQRQYHRLDSVSMAAGPEELYFVRASGAVVKCDKFLGARDDIPVEKMFGGTPLFSAAACGDRLLYLATRPDSPLLPSHVICIDTTTWNPVFSVDMKDKFPEITCMATDGEKMVLLARDRPEVVELKLPPRHELAPQSTFVYLDDMAVQALESAPEITLIPDPSGGVSGWSPDRSLIANRNGEGWVVDYRYRPVYEKSSIARVGGERSQYGYLKLRTLDAPRDCCLYVDLRTAETPLIRRVGILYVKPQRARRVEVGPEFFGKTYKLQEFFTRRELRPLWTNLSHLSRHLSGPVDGIDLKGIRVMKVGEGSQEHVFSLEKDFDIRPGETINGVMLARWYASPPILSLSFSPSEWTPRGKTSGAVVSQPVVLAEEARRLEWPSWEEIPFDASRGMLKLSIRSADEKYFIDRVPWVAVESRRSPALPLGRYLQWRLEMSTTDPWRPPGISGLVFGLSGEGAVESDKKGPTDRRWLWFWGIVVAAAVVCYFLIARKAWWEKKQRT